jgi:hypothetical protein
MRTEYKGTKLKDLFDARDNVPVQEYARTESYLLSGTTYVAAVSNGFMIDPYLQSDIQDDIKLFSPQGFTEICQCYQYQNYYRYNNLPSDKKVLSYFLTGEMTFYKALPSDNDGNDLNEVAGNQYYVTFSSPVSSKQWKPPYAYWLFGDKQGQPVYNCSNYGGIYCDNVLPLNSFYGNYALSLLEEYNPFAATPEEIEESGGLKQRGYANDGSKLYAFISNHKPEYVGQHLSEFFYGSVSGGVYQEYLVEFPLNSGLPFNMKLWVHTYREPSPLEGGLSYGTATPENGPCSYTTTNQFIPPDAFYAPEITVTLKFKPPHNQTTGEWEGDY